MAIWLPNSYEKVLVGLLEPDSETICLQYFTESQNV